MTKQPHPREATKDEFTQAFNQQLLQIKVLLQAPDEARSESESNVAAARRLAGQAVALSAAYPKLHAKAHLFLGHVLRTQGRWLEAHQAYVRSAPVCPEVGRLTTQMIAAYNREVEEEKTAQRRRRDEDGQGDGRLREQCDHDVVQQPVLESNPNVRQGPPVLRRIKARYFDSIHPDFYLDI